MIAIDTNVLIYSLDRHDIEKRAKARSLGHLGHGPTEQLLAEHCLSFLLRLERQLDSTISSG
jgi:predicted nucleic acid-binding protein